MRCISSNKATCYSYPDLGTPFISEKPCFNNLGYEVQCTGVFFPLFLAISIRHHALQGLLYYVLVHCMYYILARADFADPLMRYAFYQGMRSPLAHGQYLISLCYALYMLIGFQVRAL